MAFVGIPCVDRFDHGARMRHSPRFELLPQFHHRIVGAHIWQTDIENRLPVLFDSDVRTRRRNTLARAPRIAATLNPGCFDGMHEPFGQIASFACGGCHTFEHIGAGEDISLHGKRNAGHFARFVAGESKRFGARIRSDIAGNIDDSILHFRSHREFRCIGDGCKDCLGFFVGGEQGLTLDQRGVIEIRLGHEKSFAAGDAENTNDFVRNAACPGTSNGLRGGIGGNDGERGVGGWADGGKPSSEGYGHEYAWMRHFGTIHDWRWKGIVKRFTHIDSLMAKLREDRVRRILDPMLVDDQTAVDMLNDDFSYIAGLGLMRLIRGRWEIANPIYRKGIPSTTPPDDSKRCSESA